MEWIICFTFNGTMKDNTEYLVDKIIKKGVSLKKEEQYLSLGLDFNPFPRAGITEINVSNNIINRFEPIDTDTKLFVQNYIVDSLFQTNPNSSDKYLSSVIRGDYGNGKTQLLMYTKYVLGIISETKTNNKKPYVIYIDNPGARLSELIGSIIHQIGQENFKKYLWDEIILYVDNNQTIKTDLLSVLADYSIFTGKKYDPFLSENMVSYKKFIDCWHGVLTTKQNRLHFNDELKSIIISLFAKEYGDSTIATYFYDLITENIGINKTWELLTTGSAKNLNKREVYLIRAIFKLVKSLGYTDFYIFVDEFEAITEGRISLKEFDLYITNLRALIDKERSWCSLFAMTGQAFKRLRSYSPPLADRISSRIIDLKPLNKDRAIILVKQYLNLARKDSESLAPFEMSGIDSILNLSNRILRIFLKNCYIIIQRASEMSDTNFIINSDFIDRFIDHVEVE